MLSDRTLHILVNLQQSELTEHHLCSYFAKRTANPRNRRILQQIADEEEWHYRVLRQRTHRDVGRNHLLYWWYLLLYFLLGVVFSIKLLERHGGRLRSRYHRVLDEVPQVKKILVRKHHQSYRLIAMIDERRLHYMGSIVLGLNDALVELTGAIAGMTFAFMSAPIVATAGFITGVAAALSMAASAFLSNRADDHDQKNPLLSAFYTGITYLLTVFLLITPYLLFSSVFIALAVMLCVVVIVILFFTYYLSVTKDLPFFLRFLEMAAISLSVALLSFGIGLLLRYFFPLLAA